MGAHDFKLNKVPLFALESVNINVSLSAAPKQLLCQQPVITGMSTGHTTMSVPMFIRIERGSDGCP